MKKFPWKARMIGSTVMMVLVVARCVATACMERYYGRTDWVPVILADPWFYVGISAAAVVCICAIVCLLTQGKHRQTQVN